MSDGKILYLNGVFKEICKIHVNKSPALFVECLKLWQRPGFGFISPTYFNFFVALDTFILLMYCSCVKKW